jgi:hypothetical protein
MTEIVRLATALLVALGHLLSSGPPVASPSGDAVVPVSPHRDASETGVASWYRWRVGEAAAGPALRTGRWRGRPVRVCVPSRCITVVLTDWCVCPSRLIDLDRRSFARLADPSRGLVRVRVSW